MGKVKYDAFKVTIKQRSDNTLVVFVDYYKNDKFIEQKRTTNPQFIEKVLNTATATIKNAKYVGNNLEANYQKDGIKKVMDNIREHFGQPITITSGTRCKSHNAKVGGVSNSYNLYGNACDFVVKDVSSAKVMQYINQLKAQGLVRYAYSITSDATHIDTGGLE